MNTQAPYIRLGDIAAEWGWNPKRVTRTLQRAEIAPVGWGKYKTADIRRFMEENSQPQNNDHMEVIKLRTELRALKEENARLKEILRVIRREVEER